MSQESTGDEPKSSDESKLRTEDGEKEDVVSGGEESEEKSSAEGSDKPATSGDDAMDVETPGEKNEESKDEGENKEEGEREDDENESDNAGNDNEEQVDPIFDQMLLKPLFERREKSLKELLESMDEFSPIIPDAVTDYYLSKSGFKTTDHRIKRLLALATQKFVADITNDAYQFSRIRAQTANAAGGAGRGRAGPGSTSGRTVLTMESLNGVLGDYGINAKRPDFYR